MAKKWCKLPQSRWKPGQGVSMPNNSFISDHLISKGIKTFDQFTDHVKAIESDFWGNRFYKYAEWKDDWYFQYQKTGFIDFLTGFRAFGVMSKNDVTNYPVQGAAFHCLLWSLIQLDAFIIKNKLRSRIIGQIHDSIVLDVYPQELSHLEQVVYKIICEDLPNVWKWIIVPIKVDMEKYEIDGSWANKIKAK
jgi:hypothetical protein